MVSGTLGTNGLCENHGFQIHTCEKPFTVYPNKTRRIDITLVTTVYRVLPTVVGSGN